MDRTGDQIRESTQREYWAAMKDFIKVVGNMDYQQVTLKDGEFYRQKCLDRGNSRATVAKKLRHLKCLFHAGVKRRLWDENPLAYISMPRYSKNDIRRRTAICNWFGEGMGEFDVMKLAGHADFRTTHRFYLRVQDDLVQRARRATERGLCQKLLQICCNYPSSQESKRASDCKCLPDKDLPSGQDWS